ncbi:unnamed protein product [Owenia fusiformis]|uniref:Putative rRNA methyltransferase n=1 Tax=Owenia fusiformis TaxID=6347 RepID=A0A8J1YB96_OWEFU|nr:unnamed protein product [Owenia fusiformis]
MGKKVKTGKSRKDKFYQLAKETGYRARSSFKLLQLNRKFQFLQKSRVLIDLCAAPGSWCQVAAQHMPISSQIIGVDLVAIKPIPNVILLQDDITTESCRQKLKKELQTWKADVVLNDGAPNVGKNWIYDAFSQSQLTLQAMKLATEFLRKGGWFITKVFRSKDYHSLMWVFKQLFKKVHATKPQASRNESAEIFIVCQGYLAPDKLDPKFTDPKHIFNEFEGDDNPNKLNLLHPEKQNRQREGYADGDLTLYHTLDASKFISSSGHLELLAVANEIVLDDEILVKHKATTDEIKECCKDIKVLGRKEIKMLLGWRSKIRKWLEEKTKEDTVEKEVEQEGEEESSDEDDMEKIQERLKTMKEADAKEIKKKRKKVMKEKRKLRDKLQLKMVIPGDKLDMNDDNVLFDLDKVKGKKGLGDIEDGDIGVDYESDASDESDIETNKKKMIPYNRHEDNDYMGEEAELEFESDDDDASDEEEDGTAHEEEHGTANPLLVDLENKDSRMKNKMDLWYSKDVFKDLDLDEDEDVEIERAVEVHKKKGGVIIGQEEKKIEKSKKKKQKKNKTDEGSKPEPIIENNSEVDSGHESEQENDEDSDSDSSSSDSDEENYGIDARMNTASQNGGSATGKKRKNKDGFEIVPKQVLDPTELALGEEMVKSKKRRREIIEDSFNRYTFDDENLPDWFMNDEKKHRKRHLPVTKEQVQAYKERMKAIDARPIKKVAEAKGRKKMKEVRRLERARKKAETVSETQDVSDKEKWSQIKAIYKKAGLLKNKKKDLTYVVAKRGTGKKVSRPAGVRGQFKVVDPRMKKDNMREKNSSGKKQKSKGGRQRAAKGGKKGGKR